MTILANSEPCPDCPDDPHFGAASGSVSDQQWDGSEGRFSDEQYQRAAAACDPGDGTVKQRCFLPHHEPDGTTSRAGVHAAAQRVSALKGRSPAAVARAKAHLRAHYGQLGDKPPASIAAAQTDAASFVTMPEGFAAVLAASGAPVGVDQTGDDAFTVITASGESWVAGTYREAVALVAAQMADRQPAVLGERWRSEMAYEGRSTAEIRRRRLAAGAVAFRDCPLPLMLQTVKADGHLGAVLAGTIEQTGMQSGTAVGEGSFDDTPAGRQARDVIAARGRFGVSVDGGRAEADFECTDVDEDGECSDGELVFSLLEVMGLTMTPFPAFADAYIELAGPQEQPVAASAASLEPHHDVLVAAGGPARPPREWFDDPGFFDGDPRLVRQPDGQTLCPLTVTAEGRVFGHFAGWQTCHTAYDTCVRPPRSRTGYAAFMLRPLETADGDILQVGHISMGCGHCPDDGRVPIETIRAHYDGGPGAVLMAHVRVGEDRYGGWFAGALAEDVTDMQVRRFAAMSVSGHWREVWRGKGLDLLACLAGVPVPGFPVTALAASWEPIGDAAFRIGGMHTAFGDDGRPVALVAAGIVRQPMPWERMVAALSAEVEDLRARLSRTERIAEQFRGEAAERLQRQAVGLNAS